MQLQLQLELQCIVTATIVLFAIVTATVVDLLMGWLEFQKMLIAFLIGHLVGPLVSR